VPVIALASIRKTVSFDARYTSGVLNDRLAKLEGKSLIVSGLEVIRIAAGMIRVFPGTAFLNGRFIEITAPQDLTIPPLFVKPFALYLRSNHDSTDGAVFLDFSQGPNLPRDSRGFLLLREWPAAPINPDLMVAEQPDPMLGEPAGVRQHRLRVATGSPNQSVFSLSGLSFEPIADELLVWANGVKQRLGSDVLLDGLNTLTLATPILTGERLEIVVLRGVRFREEQTGLVIALITLSGANDYTPVLGDILVFKNGVLLVPVVDYAETSSISITLTVPAIAPDIFEIYGIDGLLHRETHAVAADETVDLEAHGYRTRSHDLLVFGDGAKLSTDFDYSQPNGEQIRLVEVYQASQTALAPVPGPPTSTFTDAGAAFESSRAQIGKAVLRVTAVTAPPLEINTIPQVLPVELPINIISDETNLDIVDTFTTNPGDVTYDVRTPSFDGTIHTVLLRSFISPIDAVRDLGEFFDIGRGVADAIIDPDSNRPGTIPAGTFNPFITIDEINDNAEVVAARGIFAQLNDRLNTLVSGAGTLVVHGPRHVQTGPDPIPNVTATVDGLMSAIDKGRLDAHVGGGGAEHLNALPAVGPTNAGFMSGGDKIALDQFNPNVMPRGVWALNFFGDSNPLTVPAALTLPEKSGTAFFILTRDGSVPEIDSVNVGSLSLTARFSMFVDVDVEAQVLFSMTFILHNSAALWVGGVKKAIGSVGSGRFEGTVTIPAVTNTRIDVVYYGGGGGPFAGCRCAIGTDLLNPNQPIRWRSAPAFGP
jgi:hypothetical protein